MSSPDPISAPPHIQHLTDLHKKSLEQEASISKKGKALSGDVLNDTESIEQVPSAAPQEAFDRLNYGLWQPFILSNACIVAYSLHSRSAWVLPEARPDRVREGDAKCKGSPTNNHIRCAGTISTIFGTVIIGQRITRCPTWNYAAAQVYGKLSLYYDSRTPEAGALMIGGRR
ncbi:uncharacterized protein BP01DRAFT_411180 [Aspergillus saccharolyticus JOP 1030-1]|uniref:Uncharacterized protein n=1 Tax=Aspergillus saccharolyticus JOP 1030-1 TaxID=1450539 RepID=A0A318ZL40_9EURO|nr:hypothetical protein BP01DRAFT_411180 [Aspergillus saccharolyticus JOP 1030-1]PYH47124.1 hypothetical protein BP01DRAFT_411180 [Aspergillus saccharolyticus JOP 1030-1]